MRLGIVSHYPPRRGRLAAYAGELVRALSPEFDVIVCAVDRHGLDYPDEVAAVIAEDDASDYRRAGRVLAEHAVDAVLIQYDEGLFGGPSGTHVLELAHELRLRDIPYLVTAHSPPPAEPAAPGTLAALTDGAARTVVFSEQARRAALARRLVEPDRLSVVPLGVPSTLRRVRSRRRPRPVPPGAVSEALAAMAGGRMLFTYGYLGPAKGLETALAALPAIVAGRPDVRYLVVGWPDPDAAGGDSENYRDRLDDLVDRLDLSGHVHLVEARLTPAELAEALRQTTVYLAPGLCPERTYSGTLTSAVVAGCASVAVAHPYASETLGTGAGVTVPPGDPGALADAVVGLLDDPVRLAEACAAAGTLGRRFGWQAVARRTATLVRKAARPQAGRAGEPALPPLRLDGVAVGGASVEDAARLAVVSAGLLALPEVLLPSAVRATAVAWAGRAAHDLDLAGAPPVHGDGDAGDVGRVLWGLGAIVDGGGVPESVRQRSRRLREVLARSVTAVLDADALVLLGLARGAPLGTEGRRALVRAAKRLDGTWRSPGWPWFGDRLGADAARLPQALIAAGRRLDDAGMVRRGLASLDWYGRRIGLAAADGVPRLPGSGTERSVDAGATVEAFVEAYRATGAPLYGRWARRSFEWFLGANRYGIPLYDPDTGTCLDGLGLTGPGQAGTSTATLAYLAALLCLVSVDLAVLAPADAERWDLAAAA